MQTKWRRPWGSVAISRTMADNMKWPIPSVLHLPCYKIILFTYIWRRMDFISGVKKFDLYICGQMFTVLSDHKLLLRLFQKQIVPETEEYAVEGLCQGSVFNIYSFSIFLVHTRHTACKCRWTDPSLTTTWPTWLLEVVLLFCPLRSWLHNNKLGSELLKTQFCHWVEIRFEDGVVLWGRQIIYHPMVNSYS